MKHTIDAVKYGIDTLKVSPEDMFSLIECSNGYEGEDYPRWLANEIIRIAEKDGVGFSQLLVKKFSIISTITDGLTETLKQEWVDYFKTRIGTDNIVSVNMPEIGEEAEDVNWEEGVDTLVETPFKDSFGDFGFNSNYAFVASLTSDSCSKSSDLVKLAKDWGLSVKNKGSLLLFRMCNFIEMNDVGSEFRFAFLANTKFLCDPENAGVIKYFLNYFNYVGFSVKISDLMQDSYSTGECVFCVCRPKDKDCQDGFVFDRAFLGEDGSVQFAREVKRYSRSSVSVLSSLRCAKKENVMGWLNVPSNQVWNCTVSYEKDMSVDINIPITASNYKKVIVYYSLVHSQCTAGLGANITKVMTGHPEYDNLFYNCVPLFLFNTHSLFSDNDGQGELDHDSPGMKSLLEKGEMYFSYESKDLLEICKGFLNYLGTSAKGMSFEDVRREANHPDLNSSYMSALVNLKDYIRSVYRKME